MKQSKTKQKNIELQMNHGGNLDLIYAKDRLKLENQV